MSERTKTVIAVVASFAAIIVIAVGIVTGPDTEPSPEDRVASLSAAIKCPFCNGESLADSGSSVAADYRTLIAERVAEGRSDQQIIDEFASNFGDAFILDTSTSPWSIALWSVPLVALIAGLATIMMLRRSSIQSEASK